MESEEWGVGSGELLNRHVKQFVDVGVAVLDVLRGYKVPVALKTPHSSLSTNHLSLTTVRIGKDETMVFRTRGLY